MKKRKIKKISKKRIIITTIIVAFSVLIFYILFILKQNQDIRAKAQATTINPATANFPSKLFAPFVDVSLYPLFDFSGAYNTTKQKFYTLAFIIAGGNCTPAWGGTTPLSSNFLYDQINFLRSNGGDVIVSFGGAAGIELAQSCTTTESLQNAYQKVITQYKIRWIDLDIEGAAIADPISVDRRNKAIAALQSANPDLKVSYTLPVMPSGLTQDGLNLLKNAKINNVDIDVINLMTMDYGGGIAPNPVGKMGQYAIQSANSTRSQVENLGINTHYGITPMIGQNDVAAEKFLLTDPKIILNGADAANVTLLAFWSISRDNGGCPNQKNASPTCSGISQSNFAFTKSFQPFTTSSGENNNPPAPTIATPTFECVGNAINCIPSQSPSQNEPSSENPSIDSPNTTKTTPQPNTINTPPTSPNNNLFMQLLQLLQQLLQSITQFR